MVATRTKDAVNEIFSALNGKCFKSYRSLLVAVVKEYSKRWQHFPAEYSPEALVLWGIEQEQIQQTSDNKYQIHCLD